MSSRKVKINGAMTKFSFNKNKKYKYNKQGNLEEATTISDDDIVMSGSKSSLRRMADIERNISILATKLTTTDGEATDADDASFGNTVNNNTRFKKTVRFSGDVSVDSSDTLDVNGTLRVDGDILLGFTAASTIDSRIDSKINTLVAGAPAALNTLNELAAAIGDNASYAASVTASLAGKASTGTTITAGNGLTGGGNLSSHRTINVGSGNGITVSADGVAMSGSFTGNFTASGDITAYSDDSLKTNVQVIDGALGRVEAIRGVTFERIEDGSVSTGVIAQELEAVLPEAVKTDANGVRHVAYGNITGLLIEAVKELSAQVEELKNKK